MLILGHLITKKIQKFHSHRFIFFLFLINRNTTPHRKPKLFHPPNIPICPQGSNQEEIENIKVVDRDILLGRALVVPAKLGDLEKVNHGLIRVEDEVNRTFRLLNRKTNQSSLRVSQLSQETNTSLGVITARIDTLVQNLENQRQNVPNSPVLRVQELDLSGSNGSVTNELEEREIISDEDESNSDEENNDFEQLPPGTPHRINILTTENGPNIPVFSGLSLVDFDR